jgi:hypothetical protein
MVRMVVFVLMLLALSGGATRAQDEKPVVAGVAGVYACEGKNPDGSPYKGIVEIVKYHGSFLVRWTMPDDVSVIGVGIESSGVLAVSYFGGAPGVVVYKAEGNKLLCEWTMGGANGEVFSETLTRIQDQQRPRAVVPSPERAPAPAPDDVAPQPQRPARRVPTGGTRL